MTSWRLISIEAILEPSTYNISSSTYSENCDSFWDPINNIVKSDGNEDDTENAAKGYIFI